MATFNSHTGVGAPLRRSNVDTDQIIPAEFLKRVTKTGLDDALFYAWRQDPDFVLNRADYADASILVTGANFGCGSSREHAVWGLQQFGVCAVIAPSYAEVFYSNAMTNRLLLVMLPRETITQLMDDADDPAGNTIEINITAQTRHAAMENVGRQQAKRFYSAARLAPAEREVVIRFLMDMTEEITLRDEPWLQGGA